MSALQKVLRLQEKGLSVKKLRKKHPKLYKRAQEELEARLAAAHERSTRLIRERLEVLDSIPTLSI